MKIVLGLFLTLAFSVAPALAETIIIVNPANPVSEISAKELKAIYKMKKSNWDSGEAILAVNLAPGNAVREEFSNKYLGKNTKKMEEYYLKRALSGKGQPPKSFATEKEIISFVASNTGAIGYVSAADGSVKTVSVK